MHGVRFYRKNHRSLEVYLYVVLDSIMERYVSDQSDFRNASPSKTPLRPTLRPPFWYKTALKDLALLRSGP